MKTSFFFHHVASRVSGSGKHLQKCDNSCSLLEYRTTHTVTSFYTSSVVACFRGTAAHPTNLVSRQAVLSLLTGSSAQESSASKAFIQRTTASLANMQAHRILTRKQMFVAEQKRLGMAADIFQSTLFQAVIFGFTLIVKSFKQMICFLLFDVASQPETALQKRRAEEKLMRRSPMNSVCMVISHH